MRWLADEDFNSAIVSGLRRRIPGVRGLRMPGVFEVPRGAAVGLMIADLQLMEECGTAADCEGRVIYLPLR